MRRLAARPILLLCTGVWTFFPISAWTSKRTGWASRGWKSASLTCHFVECVVPSLRNFISKKRQNVTNYKRLNISHVYTQIHTRTRNFVKVYRVTPLFFDLLDDVTTRNFSFMSITIDITCVFPANDEMLALYFFFREIWGRFRACCFPLKWVA